MCDEIQKNVKTDIVTWMTPSFTTTTTTDVMVANLAVMSTVREYFDQTFELSCGLSQLTLEGTLEDWQKLYEKTFELLKFKIKAIDEWCQLMLPVLKEFVQTYQGIVNNDFWQKICTSKRRGSGDQKCLRGWFVIFGAFDDHGKYLLNTLEYVKETGIYGSLDDDSVPDCGLSVNITIDDHGKEYHTVFYAGLLLTQYDAIKNLLSPSVDWIMIEKKQLTLQDLEEKLHQTKNYNFDSGYKTNPIREFGDQVLQIAYDEAVKAKVPNELMIELIHFVGIYCLNYAKNGHDLPQGIRYHLARNVKWDHNVLAKYFKTTTCEKGHPLVSQSFDELCQENDAYENGYRCDVCDGCYEGKSILHCSQCGFDVCPKCSNSCEEGHPLVKLTVDELCYENSEYINGYWCDLCGAHNDSGSVCHCGQCCFDMCPECSN